MQAIRKSIGYKAIHSFSYILHLLLRISSRQFPISRKKVVIVAPHQDDETLGCGGLIALKCKLGISVKVIFLTDGQLSRPDTTKFQDIINVRQQEAIAALKILGVSVEDIYFINQIDGTLQQLCIEENQALLNQLAQLLESLQAEEIYVPHRFDLHPDHEASFNLTIQAITLSDIKIDVFQYPVWMLWQNPLNPQLNWRSLLNCYTVSIKTVKEQKDEAINCYQSQISSMTPEFLSQFRSNHEIYFKL